MAITALLRVEILSFLETTRIYTSLLPIVNSGLNFICVHFLKRGITFVHFLKKRNYISFPLHQLNHFLPYENRLGFNLIKNPWNAVIAQNIKKGISVTVEIQAGPSILDMSINSFWILFVMWWKVPNRTVAEFLTWIDGPLV